MHDIIPGRFVRIERLPDISLPDCNIPATFPSAAEYTKQPASAAPVGVSE
jgi:hypothetical protein